MSDHRGPDIHGPLLASLRNNLGLLADELMRAKIALVRKINARIEVATTAEELQALRTELSQAILSDDDLTRVEATVDRVLDMAKKRAAALIEIENLQRRH